MSEYQYYEFRSVDRHLTEAEIDDLGAISTRAEITPTCFTNHYEWGDLKADPLRLLEKYFDAFLYVSNWGTRRFWVRMPKEWFDYKRAKEMFARGAVGVDRAGKYALVGFDVGELEPDDLDDGTGWMGSLISLRSDLLRGDLRCLYLGWLASVQVGELDDDEPEPVVPDGLRELTASLRSLVDFLCLNQDLIEAAVATSAPIDSSPNRSKLEDWIRNLTESDKTNLLVAAVVETGERWRNELFQRFYRENQRPSSSHSGAQLRTAGELRSAAETIANERAQKLAEKKAVELAQLKMLEEANRARYLDLLANQKEATWEKVARLIQKKQPKAYDQAVRLLIDLRDLAVGQQLEPVFRTQIEQLRGINKAKGSFLDRLTAAGL